MGMPLPAVANQEYLRLDGTDGAIAVEFELVVAVVVVDVGGASNVVLPLDSSALGLPLC